MRLLIAGLLTLSCLPSSLPADTLYSNLGDDKGTSLIFSTPVVLSEAGDQIQFAAARNIIDLPRIGVYNETAANIISNAPLRIYDVDRTDPLTTLLGTILGTFNLLNYTFTSGEVELIDFALNGLPVANHAIWTLAFSNPTGLGINNFGDTTVGSSSTESSWTAFSPGALSALALGALRLRRRRSLAVLPLVLLAAAPTFAVNKDVVTANDWAQIKAEYERHRHQITNNQAHSPYQGWNTTFSATGFLVTPKEGNWTWGLNLKSYGLADQIQPISAPTQSTTKVNELRHQHGNLTHWFINAPSGLEEGWTIQKRPAGTAKELLVTLEVKGSLAARADKNAARFLNATQQTILSYNGLKAWDATGRPLTATLTSQDREIQIRVSQQDAQYPITIDPTAQQAYLKASNTDADDRFGRSVAISGDTVVVGAPFEDSNATGVNGDQANNNSANSGAAYVFNRSAGVWTQQAYLKASNTGLDDNFGSSVAISGDTIVVGAFFEDSNSISINSGQADNSASDAGAVYVFNRSGSTWTQQAYLKAINTDAGDLFGYSVAISGDTIVVGAFFEDSSSSSINPRQNDNLATNSGAAYVFTRASGIWSQQAHLKAFNTDAQDQFGISVAISGDTIVVGAFTEDSNSTTINSGQSNDSASDSGAAYVFTRSNGVWSQQAYLKASNTGAQDQFGISAAISGDTIVVGAFTEDSNSTTINSGQSDDSASNAGAAYVFTRSRGVWSEQAYLKAFNTGVSDQFGVHVAISGDTIVVGANTEDSNSTSIDSGQNDNSAANAGAAYIFLITPDTTNVSIASTPTNLLFSSTGTGCAPGANLTTPQILAWTPASSCHVTFGSPQSGGAGTQYVFSQWEDASTNAARNITAPATATTYTATFSTQHLLTITANPPAGGTVTPAAPTFFDDNSVQPVTATPSDCYAFNNFTGATVTSGNVTMTAPVNLTANFTPLASSTPTIEGPVLSVEDIGNRFRQSISVTNTTDTTADISIAISNLNSGVTIFSTPTGTSTTCLLPAGSPYFTITDVPPGEARVVTIDFDAPNAAALTYTATAITGPGPR